MSEHLIPSLIQEPGLYISWLQNALRGSFELKRCKGGINGSFVQGAHFFQFLLLGIVILCWIYPSIMCIYPQKRKKYKINKMCSASERGFLYLYCIIVIKWLRNIFLISMKCDQTGIMLPCLPYKHVQTGLLSDVIIHLLCQ